MNNVAFIIPTGIGCAIGGHAGDATPAAKLIAQTCDKLILHPNVVNASDINEMPHNSLYVEGSILDRFLEGKIKLQEINSNKILVAISPKVQIETINAINAARATIGLNIEIVVLDTPLIMKGWIDENGLAGGEANGVKELIQQVSVLGQFDALAIASPINVSPELALKYFRDPSIINPWGWIEAKVSREIADALNKPVAHAPIESVETKNNPELFHILYNEIIDSRQAAEAISNCYIHCILKGLHKAPRVNGDICGEGIHRTSLICLISPSGIIGRPHEACFNAGIPIIAVEENATGMNQRDNRIIYVDNYLEAAGVINCIRAGIEPISVRAR